MSKSATAPPTQFRVAANSKPRAGAPLVAGVLVVVLCALGFASTSLHLDNRRPVVVVTKTVPAGAKLTRGDMTTKRVSADGGLATIDASQLDSMIGRTVAMPLAANTLLTTSELGDVSELSTNEAQIGLSLKDGQFPSDLGKGSRVRVFDTTTGISLVDDAVVTNVDKSHDTSSNANVIDLKAPLNAAGSVTASAAAGHVGLVAIGVS